MNPLLLNAQAAAAGGTKPTFTEEELNLRLKHVFFETGSANLNALSYSELDHVAGILKKFPYIRLNVNGHTDNVGDSKANLALSAQRAAAVKSRLISQGIEAGRLTSTGYGDTKPIESNDSEEGKKKNRRTELKVII
jgi:outer membrane protein OmpA-like peptidoglycan-associated protein